MDTKTRIEEMLSDFERAVNRLTVAEVNASQCRTQLDYNNRERAEDAFYALKDRIVQELCAMVRA